jgi:DnaK suppressor protein
MPLKQKEIEHFKEELLNLKSQLSRVVQGVKDDVKTQEESKGYSQHQADEGTDDFGRTISLELSNKEFEVIRQIDHALSKIENGTYGICDITGKEIPKKRLDAIPYASMTVEAQQLLEKGGFEE